MSQVKTAQDLFTIKRDPDAPVVIKETKEIKEKKPIIVTETKIDWNKLNTHTYDGKIETKVPVYNDVLDKIKCFSWLADQIQKDQQGIQNKDKAIQAITLIVTNIHQSSNFSDGHYADDILYVIVKKLMEQDRQFQLLQLLSEQLAEIIGGQCAQGRCHRLFQIYISLFSIKEHQNSTNKIAFIIPTSSYLKNYKSASDFRYLKTTEPSIQSNIGHPFHVFIGYAKGDKYFEEHHQEIMKLRKAPLTFSVVNTLASTSSIISTTLQMINTLVTTAYHSGYDYFCVVHDDIEIKPKNWDHGMIQKLKSCNNVGIGLYPCLMSLSALPSMFFHKNHVDIFDGFAYPKDCPSNWALLQAYDVSGLLIREQDSKDNKDVKSKSDSKDQEWITNASKKIIVKRFAKDIPKQVVAVAPQLQPQKQLPPPLEQKIVPISWKPTITISSRSDTLMGVWVSLWKGRHNTEADSLAELASTALQQPYIKSVADWGCGVANLKQYISKDQEYCGIDGTETGYQTVLADLSEFDAIKHIQTDGAFMKHVLELNYRWKLVLLHFLQSFKHVGVIILWVPMDSKSETSVVLKERAYMHKNIHGKDIELPDLSISTKEFDQVVNQYKQVLLKENQIELTYDKMEMNNTGMYKYDTVICFYKKPLSKTAKKE